MISVIMTTSLPPFTHEHHHPHWHIFCGSFRSTSTQTPWAIGCSSGMTKTVFVSGCYDPLHAGESHVTSCSSYLTRYTLHLTRYTSHLTPHTSHLTPHTSHLTPHTSHLTPHTSHLTHHTSHLTPHTSHITHHTSHITHHLRASKLAIFNVHPLASKRTVT